MKPDLEDNKNRVRQLLQGNALHEALALCARLAESHPADPEIWLLLGAINGQLGNFQETEKCCKSILETAPQTAAAHSMLGSALFLQGHYPAAEKHFHEALQLNPHDPQTLNNLGNLYKASGRFEQACDAYEQALSLSPDYAEVHNNLGSACLEMARPGDARACYERALSLNPGYLDALQNLAAVLAQLQEHDEAIGVCRKILGIEPENINAKIMLALQLQHTGELDTAVTQLERLAREHPESAEVHNSLGKLYQGKELYKKAIAHHSIALELDSNFPHALFYLAEAYAALDDLEMAEDCLHRAIALKVRFPEAYAQLAYLGMRQALVASPVAHIRKSLDQEPGQAALHSDLLFLLNYDPDAVPQSLAAAHRQWAIQHVPGSAFEEFPNSREPGRKLRVGFVSPDFRGHSVAYFMLPLLRNLDQARVESYCYFNHDKQDAMTVEFRARCDHWRDIRAVSDSDVAHRIRADRIDILVDLSGHTRNNRLPVFARRPAPVQATYLGYVNTTGLDSIDYRIVDHYTDPEGAGEFTTESLLRLDGCFLCYQPPADAPPVQGPPCRDNGYITFGSLNHPAKINERVIALWSRILHSVPDSRLLLKGLPLNIAPVRERYAAAFAAHGIARERVELMAFTPDVKSHLAIYNRIDIALDTFPYNGATTTCEALWMGVPVISLYAGRHVSRVGLSLLHAVNLAELAVADEAAYAAVAARLAADCAGLEQRRSTLRETMAASPLCDGPAFARRFEQALSRMWRAWCDSK